MFYSAPIHTRVEQEKEMAKIIKNVLIIAFYSIIFISHLCTLLLYVRPSAEKEKEKNRKKKAMNYVRHSILFDMHCIYIILESLDPRRCQNMSFVKRERKREYFIKHIFCVEACFIPLTSSVKKSRSVDMMLWKVFLGGMGLIYLFMKC